MKIVLRYLSDEPKVIDYNQSVNSLPTRSVVKNEKFINAMIPSELKSDVKFISKLKASAHLDYIGSEDLITFVGEK